MSSRLSKGVPSHIGFIMDGNRHWAKDNNKTLKEGYLAGAETLINIIKNCLKAEVKYMTVYAFSTENWKRPGEQKDLLMHLFQACIGDNLKELVQIGVRIKFIGRLGDFPKSVKAAFLKAEKMTELCDNIILNVAASYGGRAEIIDATKEIIADGLKPEEITEERFAEYTYEAGLPDPELIIRTSGEKRLSGFMLWQSAYSELYFTNKNWPDFDSQELNKALEYYQNVKRNFGE